MKIVQANKFYRLKGGAERYMLELSAWLESRGDKVVPFSMKHPDNLETPYSNYFVSFVQTLKVNISFQGLRTLTRMFYSPQSRRRMRALIKLERPDLCHVHNIYTQISPSILDALKSAHVPVVMTVHDHHLVSPQYNIWAAGCGKDYRDAGIIRATFSKFHKDSYLASFVQILAFKFHRFLRIYRNNVDIFICPSQYMKRQLMKGGIPVEKIRVNPYGIDASSTTSRLDHDGYMLFVGRLSDEKGVETIVRAAKLLPDITFKIVGRGPQMDYLHNYAHDLDNVEFLGFRNGNELQGLYKGAQAVLIPSRVHENFPLTILEAMAAGKPVIASNVGGVPELVQDHVNGILVSPTDLPSWVESILRLALDEDMRITMARKARQSIEQDFQLKTHHQRLLAIYQEVTPKHT
jgi:glycosyltransferase involved in cell wall biosynthesis